MRDDQMCIRDRGNGMKEHVTLYAQWKPKTYTVTFESGDEDDEKYKQEMQYDTSEALDHHKFTKTNSIFTHWSTVALGSHYADEAEVTNLCTVKEDGNLEGATLIANWREANGAVIVVTNNGKRVNLNQNQITLKDLNDEVEYSTAFEGKDGIYEIRKNTVPSGTYKAVSYTHLDVYKRQYVPVPSQ